MAIAAVTAALRDTLRKQIPRIAPDLSDLLVTAKSPDRARGDYTGPQLNLALLNAAMDSALRNDEHLGARAEGMAVLGVTLHYLLIAYGRDDDEDGELVCHRVLEAAMFVTHGTPLLDGADLGPLRISHRNMTALEAAALWSSFRMPYQLSAAVEVGTVQIKAP